MYVSVFGILHFVYYMEIIHRLLFYLKGQTFQKKLIVWYCVGGDGVNHVVFWPKNNLSSQVFLLQLVEM
ncbi:unnamed protein product [Brassica rapa subsp. narinosa]